MNVDILNLGSGNVKSIKLLLRRLNINTNYVSNYKDLSSNVLIIPGVGSAGPYMKEIVSRDFDKAIFEYYKEGNNIIGICLGMQILGLYSEENGGVECLKITNTVTKRLKLDSKEASHNGWEPFLLKKDELKKSSFARKNNLSLKRMISGRVYYNHEYGAVENKSGISNKAIPGKYSDFLSVIISKNLLGFQFHPEKSQKTGIELMSMVL